MDMTIHPGPLQGCLSTIPSKSYAHRILICGALAASPTHVLCGSMGDDVEATIDCLHALGANIERNRGGYLVTPLQNIPKFATLPCRESGSTLRFLLPIVGALGVEATFVLEGRLPQRPLSPLQEEMERMGCRISRPTANTIICTGKLKPGTYRISGSVSSQFISGLLMALPLLPGETRLEIQEPIASRPYIEMTREVMQKFPAERTIAVEGDWSNAAFFLAANALGSQIILRGLKENSYQGDRAIAEILTQLDHHACISAADIPDLIPVLAVVAACRQGATFTEIARLRAKESDRVEAIISMLEALGGKAHTTEDTLSVYPASLTGGIVNSHNDHRIAMAAAVAATVCTGPVTIEKAQCVTKSYPHFWDDFRMLGGRI